MTKLFYSFRLIGVEKFLRYVRRYPYKIIPKIGYLEACENAKALAIHAIVYAAETRGCQGVQVSLQIPEIASVLGVPVQYMTGFADAFTKDFDTPITADYSAGYLDGLECRAAL